MESCTAWGAVPGFVIQLQLKHSRPGVGCSAFVPASTYKFLLQKRKAWEAKLGGQQCEHLHCMLCCKGGSERQRQKRSLM